MKKINFLSKCYSGFKYLTRENQVYYAKILPINNLYTEYKTTILLQDKNNLPEDTLLLHELRYKKQLRACSHLPPFQAMNQEITQLEAPAMLKRYVFGCKLLSLDERIFFAESKEFQQMKCYIHKLYDDLETKYIKIIEENNADVGWFSDCRKIPSDQIVSNYENDRMNLQMKIKAGINYFLNMHVKELPDTHFNSYVQRLKQVTHQHYAKKVYQLFNHFPALIKINSKFNNQLHQHFVTILRETSKEIFNEEYDRQKKNALIIQCIANECYYILNAFTSSLGYSIDFQITNCQYAFKMATIIYKSFTKKNHIKLNDFIKEYSIALTADILQSHNEEMCKLISLYNKQLGYTTTERAAKSLNQMWSYTISSKPLKVAGRFVTRFLDAMGFLQTMNLSTENDIALFFVATHATRISDDVSNVKRVFFAIGRMVLGTIKHELNEANLEPNLKIRELKFAAIILFYTAMIALAAVALSFTGFMALFVGFEFIAIPVAIILIIAAASLATKATFYLINAYREWKHNSINQRMRDALGFSLASEVLTLYKNALKSVDIMLSHLENKTGLIRHELDFKDELENLKITLKKEWKFIRNDKTYPIDEMKKLIKSRIKYIYDKEKCSFSGRLRSEITHRFETQQKGLVHFCTDASMTNHPLSSYKSYAHDKNEFVFFKKRIEKLKNISDKLEEKYDEINSFG